MEWDEVVMREALLREHHRGGQALSSCRAFRTWPRLDWLHAAVPEVKYIRPWPDVGQRGRGADERVL
jgi:transcription-repair coupling factor (superfamily II helicase)